MQREINKLLFIKAIRSFMVVMPIITIYFQEVGLLVRDIFLLQVIFSVAIVLLEVPSGYFADTFGRKGSIIWGVVFGSFGFAFYYFAFSFWSFALAEILLAFSSAFLSGADSAFLYDTLKENEATAQHIKYEGRIVSATRVSEAIASLLGGFLATIIALRGIFLVEFLFMLLALPVALSLKEPKAISSMKKKKNLIQIVKFALKENKKLLYLNIFSGIMSTSTLTMVWFAQPYWKKLNVPLVYFGVMWAILNILVAVSAVFSHRLEKYFSFRKLFGFFAVTPLVFYGLLSLGIGKVALFVIPLFWIIRGLYNPISLDYINKETDSSIRATVVSVSQLFSRALFSILSPFLGYVADIWSLEKAFLASSVIFGIIAIISFLYLYSEIKKGPKTYRAST